MILTAVLICVYVSAASRDIQNYSADMDRKEQAVNEYTDVSRMSGTENLPKYSESFPNMPVVESGTIGCIHYNEYGFFEADAVSSPYEQKQNMLAATSPHFLPVMNYTASVLKTLAEEGGFDTIFVVAPNHEARGLPVTATYSDFETAFGTQKTDKQAMFMLLQDRRLKYSAGIDDRIIEEDHSAASQMPFIKYYLPDVQVVPLLISKMARVDEMDAIAEAIYEIGKKKKVFLLCSVDFSHYEPIEKTAVYDKETESAILNEDFNQLRSFDNAHVDSPESLYILARYGSYFADRKIELLDGVIMPESEMNRSVGYSYYVYVYTLVKNNYDYG
jgi:AmmeMemoRadiSam system protein B